MIEDTKTYFSGRVYNAGKNGTQENNQQQDG